MTEYEKIQQPWALLQTKEAVEKEIGEHKDKVVVILFNSSERHRNNIEYILKEQRHKCENSAVFFKCIVSRISDALASAFSLEDVPTILFYLNNKNPYKRLVAPTAEELLAELDKLKENKNS